MTPTQLAARCEAADISSLSPEQIGTYTRAFVDRGGDYIILDGWSKRWMREDVARLVGLGLLAFDLDASERESDSQYTAEAFRPTPAFVAALKARA